MARSLKSAALSKTEQRKLIIFSIIGHVTRLGLGGSMLGYGLVGTIVVVLLVVYFLRAI
jgi:hypothetical protein